MLVHVVDPPVDVVAVAVHSQVPQGMAGNQQLDHLTDPPGTLALAEENRQETLWHVSNEEEQTHQEVADAHIHQRVGFCQLGVFVGSKAQVQNERNSKQDEPKEHESTLEVEGLFHVAWVQLNDKIRNKKRRY